MEPRLSEIAQRIRSLRDDCSYSVPDMADALEVSPEDYERAESGEQDLSFTFLYRCADKLGVDMIDLLTGEGPHLTGYALTRSGAGLSIKRREGFEYLHLAATFKNKQCEPFLVTAPYRTEEQTAPIKLSSHAGQEFNYIISGQLKFAHENHEEVLNPGDSVLYDSSKPHGMIATGDSDCVFLAIVLKDNSEKNSTEGSC